MGQVPAVGPGIAVEDGSQLLPGDEIIGGEGGVRGAVDDAVEVGPHHGAVVVGPHVQVLKVGGDGHGGAPHRPVEDGDQLGPGHVAAGGEGVLPCAVDQAEVVGKVHRVGGPGAHGGLVHIGELVGVGLAGDGHGEGVLPLLALLGEQGHGDGHLAGEARRGQVVEGGDVVGPVAGGVGVVPGPVVGGAGAVAHIPQQPAGGGLAKDHGDHRVFRVAVVEVVPGEGEAGGVTDLVPLGGGHVGLLDQDLQAAAVERVPVGPEVDAIGPRLAGGEGHLGQEGLALGSLQVVIGPLLDGEGAHLGAGDGIQRKDHRAQPGDGGGAFRGTVPLDQLVDEGEGAALVFQLVQGAGALGQAVHRPEGGAGVHPQGVDALAGEHLGAVQGTGGGDGAGVGGVGGGGHLQGGVGAHGAALGVGPLVGEGVVVGDVCLPVVEEGGGGGEDGVHPLAGLHPLLLGGEDQPVRQQPGGGDGEGILPGNHAAQGVLGLRDRQDGGGALGHGGHLAVAVHGGHLGVAGAPDHVLVPCRAQGVVHLGGELAGLPHGEELRPGGGDGDGGGGVLGHGDGTQGRPAAGGGGDGDRPRRHAPEDGGVGGLALGRGHQGGDGLVGGGPGDGRVLAALREGGGEGEGLAHRQGGGGFIQGNP